MDPIVLEIDGDRFDWTDVLNAAFAAIHPGVQLRRWWVDDAGQIKDMPK